jgi:DNA repair exonuclease SbcCD ATPase subunit
MATHKLTNVEAQRIMAILEETGSKLQLLSHVPPLRRPAKYDSFLQEVGPDVAQVLDEQVMLEQQYKWVSTPQHEQADAGFDGDQALPDFETLDDELRHSTRVVCRMLREAPAISERAQQYGSAEPTEPMRKFLASFAELKSQTFTKLSRSVEEERSNEDWFLEISAREEKASQELKRLQREIQAERDERERDVSSKNETIKKLRDELEAIQTATVSETKALESETKAAEEADHSAFTSKEAALSDELDRLTAELARKKVEHKEAEDALRKRKVKYEGEVAQWITQYDKDMDEKDREISALRLIYEEERKELNRLEDYFSKLTAEREAALAEERKKAEERARQQAQQATLAKAATMLQKMWRGKVGRRELEKKKSGKGGKGKKKK